MRIALMVEYDGSQYHGWQAQEGLRTIQQVVEQALSQVADQPISVVCAGRTDTGVHATNQVLHFDSENDRPVRSWIYGANSYLPKDVCIKWGREMTPEFNARYSALSRRYRYVIYNAAIRPALLKSHVTWQYKPLDDRLMQEAAQTLVGEHDFTSFRAMECQSNSPMREIKEISTIRKGDFVMIDIRANAFLHHMVRNIAGVLMAVGCGRHPVAWVNEVLSARDRKLGAETAPPYGLYLVEVEYPAEFNIYRRQAGPSFLMDD